MGAMGLHILSVSLPMMWNYYPCNILELKRYYSTAAGMGLSISFIKTSVAGHGIRRKISNQ